MVRQLKLTTVRAEDHTPETPGYEVYPGCQKVAPRTSRAASGRSRGTLPTRGTPLPKSEEITDPETKRVVRELSSSTANTTGTARTRSSSTASCTR